MRYLPLALVLIVTAAVFAQVTAGELLVWDDDVFLYQNPHLAHPDWQSVRAAWTRQYAALYVPVSYTAWIGLARCFGAPDATLRTWWVNPRVYHTASLLVHLATTCLAYLLLAMLVGDGWAAAAGALLFAIHPLQVESVAWASAFKDLLGSCFGLLAVLLLVRGRRAARHAGWLFAGATLAFILALLSKPNLVVLPLLALVVDAGLLRTPLRTACRLLVPWLMLSAALALLTCHVQEAVPYLILPVWQRLFVAGDALAFYLGKLAWPVALAADYSRMPAVVLGQWWGYVTWLAPVAVFAVAMLWRCRSRWALPALFWFALALAPVLGLLPFRYQIYSTVADHYAGLALFGPALALAGLALHARSTVPRFLIVVVLLLLSAQSGLQTITWQSNIVFWQHTIAVNPSSYPAHVNLGTVYDMLHKAPEAAAEYQAAVRLRPDDAAALYKLALVRADLRQYAEARRALEQVVALAPEHMEARQALADVAAVLGDDAAAVAQLRVVLAAEPGNELARQRLGEALARLARAAP